VHQLAVNADLLEANKMFAHDDDKVDLSSHYSSAYYSSEPAMWSTKNSIPA